MSFIEKSVSLINREDYCKSHDFIYVNVLQGRMMLLIHLFFRDY